MFGLMRHAPRLPYCGTCKTLGARYGQGSRMLLNHDIVFLGELLMRYASEPQWSAPYRSFNCFAKPKDIYPILDYTAAVTVILAHYRVADHVDDSGRCHWRAIAQMLSPSFRKASARLRDWDFPLDELEMLLRTQRAREQNQKSLADVAEPTAIATSMVFAHGARFGGNADELRTIGYRFGYLIYVLDAFEDRTRDASSGAFNALAQFPEIDGRAEILKTFDEIELPVDLKDRLRANIEERLGLRPHVPCCVPRKTLRDRWHDAIAFARRMREREQIGFVMFGAAALIAVIFPHHARGGVTSREILTIPFSLMALGTVLGGDPANKSGCLSRCGNCCGNCACDGCGDCCSDGCCSACDC